MRAKGINYDTGFYPVSIPEARPERPCPDMAWEPEKSFGVLAWEPEKSFGVLAQRYSC